MPEQSSSLEMDDGGFVSDKSSRQPTPTTLTPSPERVLLPHGKKNKDKKKAKSKKMEEFDYESPHSHRAPINFDGQSKMMPTNHPFLEMDSAPISHANIGISVLPSDQAVHLSPTNGSTNGHYTLTGTIKRGNKSNQIVEVKLTQAEMDAMNKSTMTMNEDDGGKCGIRKGPHIVLWTLIFCPLSFLSSIAVCFYVGTMCWYNIYLYLSEERSIWHRMFLCPLLILFYPVLLISTLLPLALFAACKQVSWNLLSWLTEIRDYDKGFYGWLCNRLGLPECAPYEVVIIDDSNVLSDNMTQSNA